MHTVDPALTTTLVVMAAAVLMVRAGTAKRMLSWRKVDREQRRRR